MPAGYPYNLDSSYGPVPMVTDDGKQLPVALPMIKEERLKESPSPSENPKSQPQVSLRCNNLTLALYVLINLELILILSRNVVQIIPAKLIKTEPPMPKELKHSPHEPHQMHPKDMSPALGAYPGMFQRHSINIPQPPPHNMREEDLRR